MDNIRLKMKREEKEIEMDQNWLDYLAHMSFFAHEGTTRMELARGRLAATNRFYANWANYKWLESFHIWQEQEQEQRALPLVLIFTLCVPKPKIKLTWVLLLSPF